MALLPLRLAESNPSFFQTGNDNFTIEANYLGGGSGRRSTSASKYRYSTVMFYRLDQEAGTALYDSFLKGFNQSGPASF
jgi:hypothetical protein